MPRSLRPATLLGLAALFGCAPALPASQIPPESDAGALLEPDRDAVVARDGRLVQVTALPGAEELEVVSPDGAWVGFVAGASGLAAVWAAPMPVGDALGTPVQLTNVGLESVPRVPGQPPPGFVPVPDADRGLRWRDDRTLVWTAAGVEHSVQVPR